MTMKHPRRWLTHQDVWFAGALVLSAFLIALPLAGGGLALYLDNPPHLAEINAAAHDAHGEEPHDSGQPLMIHRNMPDPPFRPEFARI